MNKIKLNQGEKIKDIQGYEGLYAVTTHGRVWSYKKKSKYISHKGKWLKKTIDKGYEYIGLHREKINKKMAVHRIVANTFLQSIEGKSHINHINGIKNDNNVNNVEWCTPKENCQHAWDNGLSKVSDKVRNMSREKMNTWNNSKRGKEYHLKKGIARRKISIDDASEICEAYATGLFTQKEIAIFYHVCRKTISYITLQAGIVINRKLSKYKGVSYDNSRNKWLAFVNRNDRFKNLGRFDNEEDAAKAYLAYTKG